MAPTEPRAVAAPPAPSASPSPQPTQGGPDGGVLGEILRERRTVDDEHKRASTNSIGVLLRKIDEGTVGLSPDMRPEIARRIGAIDAIIEAQLNQILHHPEFQRLEATWRGLHGLVGQAGESGPEVHLRVLNASKSDLHHDLTSVMESDQSILWRKVYEERYGSFGGEPFGALIGDYEFTRHPKDIELLRKVSGVAAGAHSPFLTAASPELFGWESFLEEADTRKLDKLFQGAEYTKWRSFRESDDSRYVALCLPKVLLRLPYGRENVPVEAFDFEEDVADRDHGKYLWGNAAYALGGRLIEAFSQYGWCAAIRGMENGGKVSDLPIHEFRTDSGAFAKKCPTEVALSSRREAEYCDHGFIPLVHCKNTDYAVFFGTPSCHKPPKYSTDEANANARLGARLEYMMAICRVAHYLKAIALDKVGSFMSREDCERFLNEWISDYTTPDETASEEAKARQPFRESRIDVEEVAGKPGCYTATAFLRPHFMLDELTVSLRLVAQLPESRKS